PAAAIVRALRPRLVVPMHYRTDAVNFLDPPDEFLDALGARVERVGENELEAEQFLGTADDPIVALLAPPLPESSSLPRRGGDELRGARGGSAARDAVGLLDQPGDDPLRAGRLSGCNEIRCLHSSTRTVAQDERGAGVVGGVHVRAGQSVRRLDL